MSRNLIICCDGTANEFARNNTNVVKLYSVLRHDPATQASYYHPGLGTMEPAGALTTFSRKLTKLMGMAIGYGLADDIRAAYVFLMNHYQAGDRLFMFGFSRGAYTVRAVGSLLHMYGLIRPGNEPLVPYAIRMLMGIQRGMSGTARDEYFDLARGFKETMSWTECKPWFVGVWDTVSSVGWVENPLKLPYISNNPSIQIGRHAVAIDERRAFFRSHLWIPPDDPARPFGPKDLQQVWFPGVHSDVGGGYPEKQCGLSKIALEWMLDEATAKGLLVDEKKRNVVLGYEADGRYVPPEAKAKAHESLKGFWHLAEFVWKKHYDRKSGRERRRMNFYRRRTIPRSALVHTSAYERGDVYRRRIPADAVRVGRAAEKQA
jgi:uncharacterized protein (DUF2235 family)